MKLTTEQRDALVKKKRDGSAFSDLLIYGAVKLGTREYRPNVAKTARVELSAASDDPAALARILERHAAKASVSGALLDVICAVIVDAFIGLARAPAKHAAGAVACAAALEKLLARPRSLPMFGESAISALVAFWLASKPKPANLTAILDRLIPAEISDESLVVRVVEYRQATAPRR
ncbi:MAG TPA: hypothetical protein VIU61_18115 [Kofleriaceae bacterium]